MTQAPIALTMGDPAGIGPEITLRAWAHLTENHSAGDKTMPVFACLADIDVLTMASKSLGLPVPQIINDISDAQNAFRNFLPVIQTPCPPITPGQPSPKAADAITGSIANAVALAASGHASAVVTNPIAKHILYEAGFTHPGHTEYLGALTANMDGPDPRGPVMMLSGGGLSVALVTIHIAISEVPSLLSQELIIQKARIMHDALRRDFGIQNPRIAMAGLNPHAGEKGSLGREEIEIINPAAAKLRAMGLNITDAQPADTLFHAEAREGYDAALAMYHDQGLIPVKTLDFHGGVNITLGLPIIRTSPDHGTAFDIAGKNIARPDSLIAALKTAQNMATHRFGA